MDQTSLFYTCAKPYAELLAESAEWTPDEMRALIINEHYNGFCRDHSDTPADRRPCDIADKAIPYMGWFWRACDFAALRIPVGFGEGYVGVMRSNKWGYPSRLMTEEEARTFVGFIDEAIAASRAGGNLEDIEKATWRALARIDPWMQSLTL